MFFVDLTTPFQGNVIRFYLAGARTNMDVLKTGDLIMINNNNIY